ncbi:hypothetical protein GCM10010327_67270 [Streptomyces nitrosporeus]|nr:hypothetical protein GCM10010327_67270 [Streptomyces nitrosporeus]
MAAGAATADTPATDAAMAAEARIFLIMREPFWMCCCSAGPDTRNTRAALAEVMPLHSDGAVFGRAGVPGLAPENMR